MTVISSPVSVALPPLPASAYERCLSEACCVPVNMATRHSVQRPSEEEAAFLLTGANWSEQGGCTRVRP